MRKITLLLVVQMLFTTWVFAQKQTVTVTGKVTDEKGAPIAGASVLERGTKNGTSTDTDGTFLLKVRKGAILVVTSIGFGEKQVKTSSNVWVTLTSETTSLNDVVITGVGAATSKKKVPIDVASLSSKDFPKSATTSIEDALVGQIAGAQIQKTSGTPGSGANIILRGITNLDGTSPLILIDGVQSSSDLLSSLDPSNIEKIEIVKGAAGGMLYGSQGGNGVIQVFTKRGIKNGKLSININSKVSIDNILRGKKLVADYHHYVTDASGNILDANGNILQHDAVGFWPDPEELPFATDPTVVNNKKFNLPTYDHLKQGFQQAITTSNSIDITGGGTNSDYSFSASNLNQQDVFSNNFTRTNLNMNLGFELAKGLTFRTNTQGIYTYEDLLSGNRFALVNSYQWIDFKWKDSLGNYVLQPKNENQINSLSEKQWHQHNSKAYRIVQNFDFNYKFPRFVELDYKYSIDYKNTDYYDYYLNQTSTLQSSLHWGSDRQGSITDQFAKFTTQYSNANFFFRTDFKNDFKINIPLKTTTQVAYDWRKEDYRYYYSEGIELPTYPPSNISVATTKTSGDYSSSFIMFGYLINQSFDYGNLFGISGGFRSDYSSEFGSASKAFTFPRGTAYFRPSELFANHSFLTDWKIRGAYGEAGVQPSRYSRQVTLDVSTLGSSVALTLPTTAHNPNLDVQTTKELEIGTDVTIAPFKNLWLNKVTLNGSWWKRKSEKVIQSADVAISTGYGGVTSNLVTLSSHGIDLSVDADMYHSPNFSWDLGVRWSTAITKVDKISNGLDVISGYFALKQGQKLGIFYGQTPLHSITQKTTSGDYYIDPSDAANYTMVNGNVVNLSTYAVVLTASDDLSPMGKAYPDFTASVINRFSIYKNLSVSFQFDIVHGNNIYNLSRQWMYRDRIHKDFDNPVTINGKTGAFVAYYNSYYNSTSPDSWFVENGSFVRLRDLSISYNLTNLINKKWMKQLIVTASGRNLLTFTKYKGLDPENTSAVDSQGNTTSNMGAFIGVDDFGVPNLKSYQFSLSVGF